MSDQLQRSPSIRDVDPVTDLLSRLRLDHPGREHGALIVEGPTDRKVLGRVLPMDRRRIFAVAGRGNVLRCARILKSEPLAGVVCVADRDFDESEANWPNVTMLVFYDEADLESMTLRSRALDRFVEEWASDAKLQAFGGTEELRSTLSRILRPLSGLRAENARCGMGLNFNRLDLVDVLDKDGELKTTGLVDRVAAGADVTRAAVAAALESAGPTCPHTGHELTRGRDAIALLGVMLRRRIGSLAKQQVANDFVGRSLRLAHASDDLGAPPFVDRLELALQSA